MRARSMSTWTAALLALVLAVPAGAPQAAPAVHTVVIEGMRFIPATLEVKAGDIVVWHNRDPFPHTATAATAADPGGPASPAIAAGGSRRYKALRSGRYPYLCTLHRTMRASLVVR